MRTKALLAAGCFAVAALGCGFDADSGAEDTQPSMATEQAVSAMTRRVAALESQVATLTSVLDSTRRELADASRVAQCVELRLKAMRAWTRHRPKWSKCKQRGRICVDTGLPPNTIEKYRWRLKRMFDHINSANFEQAQKSMDGLNFPVPEPDGFYSDQGFTKAEFVAGRDDAERLTRAFLEKCGAPFFREADPVE